MICMKKILITGANGQLGSEISFLSKEYDHQFHFTDYEELDITNCEEIEIFVEKHNIDFIVNCAAYTAVDRAESDYITSDNVNFLAVKNLLSTSSKYKLPLIHISTDYVFDGKGYKPYATDDSRNPINVYGLTKKKGEDLILKSDLDNLMLIRTSWVYSDIGNNFVKTMLRLGAEKESIKVIEDQVGTPTYARDLAKFILDSIPKINWNGVKIFHFTNEGVCSWFDFAKAIMEIKGYNCKVLPISTEDYPTPAKRPNYSVLDKRETRSFYEKEIPYWRDSLEKCLKLL
ncbi:dTDP-4-dehydrorhamnose reductase [Cecembia rubra]|uniref:dTDP-4-dehydrorhamnose reductase n=2 Tax=Cecembia rubra TaxID=1485585 RepID=A0A2P8EA33_9BACT|nr:dTDP-4-dehydrorhamnose reductase [Cecembia rubra]